jgi:hypothetical protein
MLGPSEIEIRPFYELQDFAQNLTPEVQRRHDEVRAAINR